MDLLDDQKQETSIYNESLENNQSNSSANTTDSRNLDPWTNFLLNYCSFDTELTESIKKTYEKHSSKSGESLKRKANDCFDIDEETIKLKRKIKETATKIELQYCKCLDILQPYIKRCRECHENNRTNNEICRFLGWRKLIREQDKRISYDFLSIDDINHDDKSIWALDSFQITNNNKFIEYFKMIFNNIKEDFEEILAYESKILNYYCNNFSNKIQYWKRMLPQTRELCDQCDTTIFNGHFFCESCGYSVCLNCFELRNDKKMLSIALDKKRDSLDWLFCYDQSRHLPQHLKFAQIIPPKILNDIKEDLVKYSKLIKPKIVEVSSLNDDDYTWFGKTPFLVLNDPKGTNNYDIFTREWPNCRTLLIRNVHHLLNPNLWTPQSLSNEFGHLEIDLVNCRNHEIVPNVKLSKFWDGFENISKRMVDSKGRPTILKLKDWPSSEDFKEIMPTRFNDLMKNIPLQEYTSREGCLNLVSNLPNFFLKPDLGPKMYVAYSSAQTPKAGTTNLHVDISDALNVMLYVGQDQSTKQSINKIEEDDDMIRILRSINCDELQINRYRKGEKIGAIWHLFLPQHSDRIRAFLTMIDIENGIQPLPGHDPIHDQSHYINTELLARLKDECDVDSFTVIQYLGDAVFIPAGAPHQVRNINSCIKVAMDFVTPQGVKQCLLLTEQFRKLSNTHSNHEDKLQIKNILYHSMKNCLSVFKSNDNIIKTSS